MPKVGVNDLARELGVKSHAVLDALRLIGTVEKKTHSSKHIQAL
jgi:translation initiation factor IF-2